ncbi:host specificity factor TipJ family phage tail protein [Enterovirga rhinocerotis]|uniref:Tail protein n=1 Tax=Enterovirga rhinocerotis TaxID=1339210 RepID=A0A4R7C7G1_9HYPH|nr:methyl-accepting chemotaxis protein [Enterovirga rhinocerotis]TDR94211.1 hypothetical protein EV668_1491 [Enterovirga rhinocerotis]
MTLVVAVNHLHREQGGPLVLAPRRRRLSTIMRRHGPADRRVVALVFRKGEDWRRADRSMLDKAARLRKQYATTLVGPHDTVVLVRPALGGGQSGAGIAMAIAAMALMVVAPFAAPAIAGVVGLSAGLVQAGLVLGAGVLAAAAMQATAAKKKTEEDFLSLSASGNVARRGDRRPLIYGRCWTSPPLSQRDFIQYVGNKTTILTKRLTVGLGKFDIEEIRVGESTFWKKGVGILPPFNAIPKYAPPAAVEFLYEQPSTILPGDVATSDSVVGQELPRPGENPEWTPWYRAAPIGVATKKVYLAWNFPSVMRRGSKGEAKPMDCGIVFQYQRLDPVTGNPTGPIHRDENTAYAYLDEGGHFGKELEFPDLAQWQVRAANAWFDPDTIELEASNAVYWDEMSALLPDTRIREKTTEIVIRISGIKGLSSLGDVQVLATRILPVWTGSAWIEQPTRKCLWAYADLVRNEYALYRPDAADIEKTLAYVARPDLEGFDTYDGVLPSVSSFPDAANEVLAPLRAEYVKIGSIYSFVRDESAEEAGGRRVITRRQTIRDTSSQRLTFVKSDSAQGDVIVEFNRDGDPKRPDEVRQTLFAPTRTPKRYKPPGISSGAHALAYVNWLAAIDRYRTAERKITVEWEGRLVYPGTHILSDLWFLDGKAAVSVVWAEGAVLTLGEEPPLLAGPTYASIRDRRGREWGILRATYDGARTLTLNATDLAARVATTGKALAEILALDTQDPTTVTLGDLVELQETYIARAARPVDADNVEIEMVLDDPRVWLALGETPIVPEPVTPEGPQEILRPVIQSLRAQCQRTETDIRLVWSIGQPRGGVTYDVEFAIDDETGPSDDWQEIQSNLASLSGSTPIRQSPLPVRIRARAYGRTGEPGPWTQTTFQTLKPLIDGSTTDIVEISLGQLTGELQDKLTGTGPGSVGEAKAIAEEAKARANTAFGNIEDLKLALSPSPADRARSGLAVRAVRDDVESALTVLQELQLRIETYGGILTQIGVVQAEGAYTIAGQAQLGNRINEVSISLDALAGEVALIARTVIDGDLGDLFTRVNEVSLRLDSVTNELAAKVSAVEFGELSTEVEDLSITVSGVTDTIDLLATQASLEALSGQVTSALLQVSALGQIVAATSATAIKLDGDTRDATIEAILAEIAEMKSTVSAQLATASSVFGSSIGAMGEAISESNKTLLAVQGETAARLTETLRVVADGLAAEAIARRQLEVASGLAAGRIGTLEHVVTNADNPSSQITRLATIEGKIDGSDPANPGISGRLTSLEDVILDEDEGLARKVEDIEVGVLGEDAESVTSRLSAVTQVVGKAATPGNPATGLVSQVGLLEAKVNGTGAGTIAASIESVSTVATNAGTAAATAQGTADTAKTTADSAKSTADTAKTTADTAKSTADTAKTAAESAATTATQAQATANGVTATARFGMTARAGPNAGDSLIAMEISRDEGGEKSDGGFYLLAPTVGGPHAVFNVEQFYVARFVGSGMQNMTKLMEIDAATGRVIIPKLLVTTELIAPNAMFDWGRKVVGSNIALLLPPRTNQPIPELRSVLTVKSPCAIELINTIKYSYGGFVTNSNVSNYLYLRVLIDGVVQETLPISRPNIDVASMTIHLIEVLEGPFPKTVTIDYDYTSSLDPVQYPSPDPKVLQSSYVWKLYYRGG